MAHTNRMSLVSLLALGIAMPAIAQTPAEQAQTGATEPAASSQPARDVVVVTANKRQESVQDIAVAVTAITSEAKEQLGVISVTDLTNVTPGLSYTPGNERVTLRGIGRLSNSFGADPGVANYNDGMYTAFAVRAGADPFLIDRVEVLRGPQGTLYGRNAIGGAINTISKRPTSDFRADVVLGIGNFDTMKVGVSASGPITDSIRYRAVALKENREGIDYNYGTQETEGWEIDDYYFEGQLEGEIGDRFSWWLKVADTGYDKAGPPGGRTATFSTAPYLTAWNTGGLTPNNAFAYGPGANSFTQQGSRTDNPFATNGEQAYNTNIASEAKLRAYDEALVELVYETNNFDIKYTGGYVFYDYDLYGDADGTPINSITYNPINSVNTLAACGIPTAAIGQSATILPPSAPAGICYTTGPERTIYPNVLNIYEESRAFFSNEINFISTWDNPLQWIVGAYQYQENSDQPGQQQFLQDEPLADFYLDTVLGVVANPDRQTQLFQNVSLFNAYGVYGQADYTFNDQWKLTGGLRWSKDTKESKENAFLACYLMCGFDMLNYTRIAYGALPGVTFDSRGVASRRLEGEWDATTGTLGVEYRPISDTLLFAKYSRGYKSGGFNNLGMGAAPYTESEFVDAFEGGWKQEWLDWGLTTNAAAFFYTYKDMQAPLTVITGQQGQTGSTTFTAFVNVPEAQSYGFELEGNWNPIDPLNIGFTYAYLNAEVTDTGGANYRDVSRATTPAGNQDVSVVGNKLSQSPEHKVAINAAYRIDMEDGSWFLPTVSYSWRDEFYDTFFNAPTERAPAYDQLDARLNWYSSDERFNVILWVRNALDEAQNTSISSNAFRVADGGFYQGVSYSMPRSYGIDLKIRLD